MTPWASERLPKQRPVVLGTDVLEWTDTPPKPRASPSPTVAWSGRNARRRGEDETIQLYKTTWVNPRPDVEIVSLDFVSAGKNAAPFLVALTVD